MDGCRVELAAFGKYKGASMKLSNLKQIREHWYNAFLHG